MVQIFRNTLIVLILLFPSLLNASDWLPEIQALRDVSFQNPKLSIKNVNSILENDPSASKFLLKLVQSEAYILAGENAKALNILNSFKKNIKNYSVEAALWYFGLAWVSDSSIQGRLDLESRIQMKHYFQLTSNQNLKAYILFLEAFGEDAFGDQVETIKNLNLAIDTTTDKRLFYRISTYLNTVKLEPDIEAVKQLFLRLLHFINRVVKYF